MCADLHVVQMVKRLPTMQETRVQSLSREDLLEREMPTHTSSRGPPTLAGSFGSVSCGVTAPLFWVLVCAKFCVSPPRLVAQMVKRLPTMQEAWVQSLSREDPLEKEIATHSSNLPGKSHGQRNLVDYSPWDLKESDTTERLHFTSSEFVVTGFEIYGSISKQPRIYCCAPTRLYTEEIMFPDCVDAIAINGLPWWFRR